jgi:hypothetical protein
LTTISKARVNIEIEEAPKEITTKIIPKVLREVHAKTTEVSFRKEVIPKTLSNIVPRDARSTID